MDDRDSSEKSLALGHRREILVMEGLQLQTGEDKFPPGPRPCWRWLITETDDVDELLRLLNPQRRGGDGVRGGKLYSKRQQPDEGLTLSPHQAVYPPVLLDQ